MPDAPGSATSLLQRWVRDHDEAAARQLISGLHPLVSRIVQSQLAQRQSAGDWLQDIYLTLFRHAARYNPSRPLEHRAR